MSLTMIKLEPDMGRLIRWAEAHRLLAPQGDDDLGYALHALLAATFDTAAPKPFALLQQPHRPPVILGYSAQGGDELRDLAQAIAEPDAAEAIGLTTFAAKPMPEEWRAGARFGFSVRVRPMVRTDRDGDRDRGKEVDAFVLSPPCSDRGEIYGAWLRAHLPGVEIEQAALDRFQLSRVARRNAARSLSAQKGPDATFTGVLKITDGTRFGTVLARGIGRHRAFGFGMLLLKPPR